MTDLRARLVSYKPNGDRDRVLPAPFQWTAGLPLNDVPTLSCTYTALAPGGALLAGQVEVGIEVSTDAGQTWTEPHGARFLTTSESGDDADTAQTLSPTAKGIAWHLTKAVIHPHATPNADNTTENGERIFAGASPGAIMRTLLDEAHARGVITPLTLNATASLDSAGQTWTETVSLNLPIGQDLMTVLRQLSDQGLCDWTTEGRALRLYRPETFLGRDKTDVILRTGVETTEASRQSTVDDAAGSILLLGDDGVTKTITNAAAPSMFGAVWETADSMAGVPDEGSQEALGQALLAKRDGARVQRSRQLALPKLAKTPFADFRTGDTITADGADSSLEAQRVTQMTLSRTAAGLGLAVTLNDRFLIGDLRRDRQINQIRGTSGSSGGNGGVPGSTGPDTRTPKQVVGLAGSSAPYVDSAGVLKSQVTLTWARVTAATDDVAQVIAAYYIERRVPGGAWAKIAEVLDPTTTFMSSPYDPGSAWEFRVQALSAGWVLGAHSTPLSITGALGDTTPPKPTDPVVSSRLGIVEIAWDGEFESAPTEMFSHVLVETNAGSGWAEVGRLTRAGSVAVPGLPYASVVSVRLTAYNLNGRTSAPTDTLDVTVAPLVNTDLIGQVVAGANIVNGSINAADKVIANTITGLLIQGDTIEAGHLKANSVTAAKIDAGAVTAAKIAGDAIDGKTITGAIIRTAASGARIQLDSVNGIRGFDASNVVKTQITTDGVLSAVDASITGTFRNRPLGQIRLEIEPTNTQYGGAFAIGLKDTGNAARGGIGFAYTTLAVPSGYLNLYGNQHALNDPSSGSIQLVGNTNAAYPAQASGGVQIAGVMYTGGYGTVEIRGSMTGISGQVSLIAQGVILNAGGTVSVTGSVDFTSTATKRSARTSLGMYDDDVYDTGWVTITFSAGYTGTAQCRRTGNLVQVRWYCSTSIAASASATIFTVPVGSRPSAIAAAASVWGQGGWDINAVIDGSGVCTIRNTHTTTLGNHSGSAMFFIG